MTRAAWRSLDAEYDRLKADIEQRAAEAPETPDGIIRLPVEHAARRLEALALTLAGADHDDDPTRAAIGRRLVLREPDGEVVEYTIVAPGDGDPGRGWVSADAPLGAAVLGQRAGDVVEVVAPAGRRTVQIVEVHEPAVS